MLVLTNLDLYLMTRLFSCFEMRVAVLLLHGYSAEDWQKALLNRFL